MPLTMFGKVNQDCLARGDADPYESTSAYAGADAFDDVWESDPRLPSLGLDQSPGPSERKITRSEQVQDELRESFGPSTAGTLSTAAVAAGGVALLAERFGGSKKKKKGKQKKTLDKRQPQDDMFDDPALWEGADKKSLQTEVKTEANLSTTEDVGKGGEEKTEPIEAREEPSMLMRERITEPESKSHETARQGAPLDDDFSESPVLGRGEVALGRSEPTGLLRRGSEVEGAGPWTAERGEGCASHAQKPVAGRERLQTVADARAAGSGGGAGS